jgi:sulfide:quinone oxidoreductase
MKRVVILGGGVGGTITANILARRLSRSEAKITLIDKQGKHYYQPGFMYVAFGNEKLSNIVKDESVLLRKKVELIVDEAVRILPDDKIVDLRNGGKVRYDYLVIATGARLVPEQVPGYEATHHFYDYNSALKLRNALSNFRGGVIAVGVGGIPYKCPPAPAEATCLLDYYFNKRRIRDKVEIHYLSPLPRIFPHEAVADVMQRIMEEKGIYWHPMFNIDHVDPDNKIMYSYEGEELKYDLLIMIPPHRGSKVIEDSGLSDDGGWIPTDKHTLEAKNHQDIYVIGDATDLPISKSGSAAHFEAHVVAKRLIDVIKGYDPTARYDGGVRCFCDAGFKKAITMSFNYENPPKRPKLNRRSYLMKVLVGKLYWRFILGGYI